MERNRRGRPRHPDVLTPAEWRVLDALRDGGTNAEIAQRLGLSADTVKTHISNMLAKLDLRDRRALAAWRPDTPRRRLGGVLAVPAVLWSVGRPLAWVGVGAAALAGVVVVVVALVALEVIAEGDPDPPAAAGPPPSVSSPTATVAPTTTPEPRPVSTPSAAPSPSPTASPSPTPVPLRSLPPEPPSLPRPPACDGFDCVEPVLHAFEHRTWEPGEPIDWPEGAFALETATGRVQGYRVASQYMNTGWHEAVDYRVLSRSWVGARATETRSADAPPDYAWRAYLLFNRDTMRGWRWPGDEVHLEAVSDDHILLRDVSGSRYTLMTRDGEGRTQLSLPGAAGEHAALHSFFSPDGQTLVISVDWQEESRVYRMRVAEPRPEVLFDAGGGAGGRRPSVRADYSDVAPWYEVRYSLPRAIRVSVNYGQEIHYFDWKGDPLPPPQSPACAGDASPDGRYVAQQQGFALGHKYHGHIPEDNGPWPLVVILDAESCEPIVRVLSAFTYQGFWQAEWLSNSTGYVVGLADTHAVLHVHPEPGLTYLPAVPDASGRVPGPVPAPSGDGRYFSYEFSGVYDTTEGDWKHVDFVSGWPDSEVPWEFTSWGATHEEIHYQTGQWGPLSSWDGWFGEYFWWYLLQPRVELPPFGDELAFVVVRTESCLDLYDQLAPDRAAIGCLSDGTRVSLTRPAGRSDHPHSHLDIEGLGTGSFAHVRSEDGLEGWVSIDYLEHD